MSYKRYAVLGSNSFAGAAFVARALADGAEVMGINRSPEGAEIFLPYRRLKEKKHYTFERADINHDLSKICRCLEEFKPEVVVDFAGQGMVAESWQNPEQWYLTNIVAKVRIHEKLRLYGWLKRYMRISTPEVYGSHNKPVKESWAFNPSTPYAVSHAAIDMSLRAYHRNYDFPVIIGRFANFYGPGQQLYRIIPRTIIYALTGRKLPLHGGGSSVRAFIYCNEVADGIMRALAYGKLGEIYHFSPSRFLTIRQVVEVICQRLGVDFDDLVEVVADRPGKDKAYLMDSTKAYAELGWCPRISFEQGLDATIEWVKKNLEQIQNMPLEYIHKP